VNRHTAINQSLLDLRWQLEERVERDRTLGGEIPWDELRSITTTPAPDACFGRISPFFSARSFVQNRRRTSIISFSLSAALVAPKRPFVRRSPLRCHACYRAPVGTVEAYVRERDGQTAAETAGGCGR